MKRESSAIFAKLKLIQTATGLPPDRLYRSENPGPTLAPVSFGTGRKPILDSVFRFS